MSLHSATRWVSFEHVSQRTWGFVFFRGADWLVKFVKSRVKGKVDLVDCFFDVGSTPQRVCLLFALV